MKLEISPHIGFDNIKLGMSLGQIQLLLGKPTSQEKEYYSNDSFDVNWIYDQLEIELTFDSEEHFRLNSITVDNIEATLQGKKLIGLTEKEFLFQANQVLSDLKLEDDFEDINCKGYTSDINGISFWLVNGVVRSISLLPKYDDNDTPVYPE